MRRVIALIVVLAALSPVTARACPNCKEAVSAQPSELQGIARGYNYSVMFMLAVPFGLVGAGAFFVTRAARRGQLPPL